MDCVTDNDAELDGPTTIDGSLEETSLPTLLFSLAQEGRTGVLRLDGLGDIWLHEGRLYLATTSSSAELPKVLFDARLGPQESIAAALRTEPPHPSALDTLLGQWPEAVEQTQRLLHEYNLMSLFEILVARCGHYSFELEAIHQLGARFAEDTEPLIDKARQRTDIWRRIAARIPSTNAIFTLANALPGPLDERVVTSDEWRFLSCLNGRNTVADVINQTGESAFRVCSLLYRLLVENVIEEAQPGPS